MFRIGYILLILALVPAEARVFSYKDSGIGMMLRTTGGLSKVGNEPYAHSSGTDTVLDDGSKYFYSGELAVSFALLKDVIIRIGAELIQHRPVEVTGTNPAGDARFTLNSTTGAWNPNVAFEFILKESGHTRYLMEVGAGYADITVENRYKMADGNDLGVGDFNEKLSATGISGHLAFGVETHFVDTVTFIALLGYRYMPVPELKYKGDVQNIVNPAGAAEGEPALNHEGGKRTLDMGGPFLGLALRFHI